MITTLVAVGMLAASDMGDEMARCNAIANSAERLACYDALSQTLRSADPNNVPEEAPLPIEARARMSEYNPKLLAVAVGMIHTKGWACDSFSSMTLPGPGYRFTVICNHYTAIYTFEDRGGQWRVRRQ